MFDHHQRRPRSTDRGRDRLAHHRGGRGVEHRGRLVQQHQSRRQRENAGQRQPLGLAAGERAGGVVLAIREPHGGQCRPDPGPDLVTRHTEVLGAEGHIATHPSGHQRICGVLNHESYRRARGLGTIDQDRAGEVARLGRGQDAGQCAQEGGLARSAGPGEQHARTRLDAQTDTRQRRLPAPEGTPGEVMDLDEGAPCDRGHPSEQAFSPHGLRQGATHGLPDPAGRR